MRILWVGVALDGGAGGNKVYDRILLRELSRSDEILHYIPQSPSLGEWVPRLFSGMLPNRARAFSRMDVAEIRRAIDAQPGTQVIVSWEVFDVLASKLSRPFHLLLHNVTSDALREIFPNNFIARSASFLWRLRERQIYGSPHVQRVYVLSSADKAAVRALVPDCPVTVVAPGAPHARALGHDTRFQPELLLSGTYEWYPKRRDAIRFAREYSQQDLPFSVRSDSELPAEASKYLRVSRISDEEIDDRVRVGVVVDRFASGAKLKTLQYFADNCAVATFANTGYDLENIPDSQYFFHRVDSVRALEGVMNQLSSLPTDDLRRRFLQFRQRLFERYSWGHAAHALRAGLADDRSLGEAARGDRKTV